MSYRFPTTKQLALRKWRRQTPPRGWLRLDKPKQETKKDKDE